MNWFNRRERITILAGVALIILATSFPPTRVAWNHTYQSTGYRFLLSIDGPCLIDYARLALEWLMAVVGTGIAVWLQRGWLKRDSQ